MVHTPRATSPYIHKHIHTYTSLQLSSVCAYTHTHTHIHTHTHTRTHTLTLIHAHIPREAADTEATRQAEDLVETLAMGAILQAEERGETAVMESAAAPVEVAPDTEEFRDLGEVLDTVAGLLTPGTRAREEVAASHAHLVRTILRCQGTLHLVRALVVLRAGLASSEPWQTVGGRSSRHWTGANACFLSVYMFFFFNCSWYM
jgi:hypothetical protein